MLNVCLLSYLLQSSKFLKWQDEYLEGAGMEVYAEKFSSAFYGLAFPAVAEWVTWLSASRRRKLKLHFN